MTTPHGGPYGMTSSGPDGALWFTEPYANQLGRITLDGTITEYPVPTSNSFPVGITTDSYGNVWFSQNPASEIGEVVLNQPPVARAGGPYPLNSGDSLTLTASGTTDPAARADLFLDRQRPGERCHRRQPDPDLVPAAGHRSQRDQHLQRQRHGERQSGRRRHLADNHADR